MLRLTVLALLLAVVAILSTPVGAFAAPTAPTAKPSPGQSTAAADPTTLPATLKPARNSESRLQPNTVNLLRLIEHLFPYYAENGVIGGYRQDPIMDHPSGQALDIMIVNGARDPQSVADGHKIAAFLMANATQLGVKYMGWRQNIWYPGRDWRLMDDRNDWTQNHMDHIHVLVDGSFQATDDLVLPADLQVKLDELPNGEALRKQQELRVAILAKVSEAQSRVAAAEVINMTLMDRNSKRAKELEAAHNKVSQAVRDSYIFGMDTDLLASSMMLMSGTNVDPTITMALERTLRSQDEGLNAALAELAAAARELGDNGLQLAAARSDLAQANNELVELNAL